MEDMINEDIDAHLMSKLKEIVPELRRQIEESVSSRLQTELQQTIAQKKQELNNYYQLKIRQQVEESNLAIKNQLSGLVEKIYRLKAELSNNKPKKLSQQEEKQCIDEMVEEILNEQNLLEEVRKKLRPKIQAKVRISLEKELDEGIQGIKNQLQQKMEEERNEWVKERIEFWKRQSDLELEQLALQHSQLYNKKQNIHATLNAKKAEKKQAEQKLQEILEKNMLIAKLRQELKALKQQSVY